MNSAARVSLYSLAALLSACATSGGGSKGVVACSDDASCSAAPGGRCLKADFPGSPTYCAYADPSCQTMLRWDPNAGYGLKGTCVMESSGDLGITDGAEHLDLLLAPNDLAGSMAVDMAVDMAVTLPQDLAVTSDLSMVPFKDLALSSHDLAQAMGSAHTGDPCAKALDCAGVKAVCVVKDAQGINWPGGYCTSQCNPQNSDPQTGINPACPGGAGVCLGQGNSGSCETACTDMNGKMPCLRNGYSCFQACEPTARSECDPTVKGSCPNGTSCVRVGSDSVGLCAPACDPLKQGCSQIMMTNAACYASDDTGEGACSTIDKMSGDGQSCFYLNDCSAGLGCFLPINGNPSVCRPYCGGPMSAPCNNGKQCVDLSPNVKQAVMGICAG